MWVISRGEERRREQMKESKNRWEPNVNTLADEVGRIVGEKTSKK